MSGKRCRLSLLLGAVLLLLPPSPSKASGKLTIISPHWEGIEYEFEEAFKDYHRRETGRDVEIEWLNQGGTSEVLRFVKSEFSRSPEGIDIDIMFGGGIDPYLELVRLGLTEPYRVPDDILGRIPGRIGGVPMYDPDYNWYGTTLAGFGIIYNKVVVKLVGLPVPRTWEDLGDPELFSWVGSADPRASGSVHMAYEIILQAYGWEKGWEIITCMGANVKSFVKGASQVVKDVSTGEVACGLAIDFYAWAQVDEFGADKIGYVLPEDLTIVNPDAIAILKGAPHPELAKEFIRFVLSEEGQRIWMLKVGTPGGPKKFQLNRFSVLPSIYGQVAGLTAVDMNPFEWRSSLVYDSAKGSARWGILNDLIGVMVVDSHRDLVEAWRNVIDRGLKPEDIARLSQVPLGEEEALELASRWRDQAFRNEVIAEWTDFARRKYAELGAGSGRRGLISSSFMILAAGFFFVLPYLWGYRRKPRG